MEKMQVRTDPPSQQTDNRGFTLTTRFCCCWEITIRNRFRSWKNTTSKTKDKEEDEVIFLKQFFNLRKEDLVKVFVVALCYKKPVTQSVRADRTDWAVLLRAQDKKRIFCLVLYFPKPEFQKNRILSIFFNNILKKIFVSKILC